jgi:hypothetical protein
VLFMEKRWGQRSEIGHWMRWLRHGQSALVEENSKAKLSEWHMPDTGRTAYSGTFGDDVTGILDLLLSDFQQRESKETSNQTVASRSIR